jgi:hypothetical protein
MRLSDLDKSRSIVFRYAIPSTIVDGVAGSLAAFLAKSLAPLLPTVLFALFIFVLAYFLDRAKQAERLQIMYETRRSMLEINAQEEELMIKVQ